MAIYFTVDGSNVVTNVIEAESALEPNWIAEPNGTIASIGYTWDSSTETFSEPSAPSLTAQENSEEAVRLLEESDWTQLPDIGLTTDNVIEWRTYRSTLRGIARSPSDGALTWPTPPSTEYA